MTRQIFDDEAKRICNQIKQYREVKLQQTTQRMAANNGIPEQEILNLELGLIDKVSVRTFLIMLDKMNVLPDIVHVTNKENDILDEMADFIIGLEAKGTL